MKERDYLRAVTVARIGCAIDALKMVLPLNSDPDIIDEAELREIKRTLVKWQEQLHDKISP